MNKLVIENLSKTYPNGTKALQDVSLTINSGMFGLLGPNGAGKSTLMRTIATLQDADSGSIKFNEIDVLQQKSEVRKILGFLPQEFDFYPKVTAFDMLSHFAVLKGISNRKQRNEVVNMMLQRVNLFEHKNKKVGGFSGGMKQRLGIAQALINDPELVIVDEPTAGLDPKERRHFHNLLSEIGEQRIVILSTHIVEDVADLCTEMAIINKGKIMLTQNPISAIENLKGKIWRKIIPTQELETHKSEYNIISSRLYLGKTLIHTKHDEQPTPDFELVNPGLEDVYFTTIPENETVVE